jgi:hypothetical protein
MPISIENGITEESWEFEYDKESITLEAEKKRFSHCLRTQNRSGFKNKHPWNIFFRILNEFVWFYDIEVNDIEGMDSQFAANAHFRPSDDGYAVRLDTFKQQITQEDQHLALGIHREAVSSGSPYYEFLCYARILEIPFKNGRDKGDWIDNEILKLKGDLAVRMRDQNVRMLDGKDLGTWLKDNGRHALSHAKIQTNELVRDPNSFKDWEDIKWGNTVMAELAEKAIVDQLKVPNRNNRTVTAV